MMKAVLYSSRTGDVTVSDIPAPVLQPGLVLIRNRFSLISAGTERATVAGGSEHLITKARKRPDQVKQVLDSVRRQGVAETYRVVQDRLDRPGMLGYSCSGIVIDVASDVDLAPGTPVAAAGAGYASHAEVVAVPKNLVVPLPPDIDPKWGAFATVGAIALQGIHQAAVDPGSRIAVIGLGLVGQLTLRLLRAYGYDAVGIDQDPRMLALAEPVGAPVWARATDDLIGRMKAHWNGARADAVLITAATKSADPIELAGKLARDRGTVVVVGDVAVAPPRADYYHKELQIRYSRSYGPGRYDAEFEEKGRGYPEGYVPWTERRNLAEVLRLVATGALDLATLEPAVFPVADASDAYAALKAEGPERRVALLLAYPAPAEEASTPAPPSASHRRWEAPTGAVRIAAVGAGGFATKMLFPHLSRASGVDFAWITSARGLTAAHQRKVWKFAAAVDNVDAGLARGDADCVMVVSRHDSHAGYAQQVLASGTGLFCEKPLALTEDELETIAESWQAGGAPAMVGFNRRFAPAVRDLVAALPPSRPLQVVFRVFAGKLPPDHFFFDPAQGGRLLGEVCHFVDTAAFLVKAQPVSVSCVGTDGTDYVQAQCVTLLVRFANGSTASIVYGGMTAPGAPKELIEVAGEGVAARIEDFTSLDVWSSAGHVRKTYKQGPKGHAEEMAALVRVMRGERVADADFSLALHSSLVTCRAADALSTGDVVDVAPTTPALQSVLRDYWT